MSTAPAQVTVSAGPKRGWKSLSTWIGAVIVGVATFGALFAPWLVPHDPFTQDLSKRLLVPFWMEGSNPAHLLARHDIWRSLQETRTSGRSGRLKTSSVRGRGHATTGHARRRGLRSKILLSQPSNASISIALHISATSQTR